VAKLDVMPAQDLIDGFRGVLDFYRWCDLVIVRHWPRYTRRPPSPQMKAAQDRFAYVNYVASTLPAAVVDTWKWMASAGGLTWKDWLNRCYLSGTFSGKDKPTA